MTPAPRVTVLIPTYQRADYLRETLASVLVQTFVDFAVVVVDNASTDATADLLASCDDPRVRHVRHPTNLGLLANHNACLDLGAASGSPFLVLLSDDDLLHSEHLAVTVPVLEAHPEVGMVHTRFDMIDEAGGVLTAAVNWTGSLSSDCVESGPAFLAESMSWSCRVCSSTVLLRATAVETERFRERDFPPIDFALWLRLARHWSIAYVDDVLASYRIHGASHSAARGQAFAGGYLQDTHLVEHNHRIKTELLDTHPDIGDQQALRTRARRARRRELLVMARGATLPERRLRPTLLALRAAARADVTVLGLPDTWKLVAGSTLGRRVVDRLPGRRPAP